MGNGLSINRQRKPVPRVAVLGGGPSGLTAAYTLLRVHPEVHVDLYEADGRFGGAVKSETGGGFVYDLGPNSMNAKHAVVHHLLHKELGLTGRITPRAASSSRRFLVLKDGVLTPVPLTPMQMLRSKLLPWHAKLRLCAEPFVTSGRRKGKQGKKQVVDIEERTEVESVGQFFSRRFGKHFTDWVVDPAVGGIYSADPYNISMKHAFRKVWRVEQTYGSVLGGLLRGGFKSSQPSNTPSVLPPSSTGNGGKREKQTQQVQDEQQNDQQTVAAKQSNKSVTAQPTRAQLMQSFNYDDGMHVLTDTLVERIKEFGPRAKLISSCAVHTIDSTSPSSYSSSSSSSSSPKRQPKTPIAYQPGYWRINGRRRRYDAVITTIPAHALKDVTSNVRSLRRGLRKLSNQIPYAPVSVAVLGFDKTQMSAVSADAYGFGALVPSCEKSTAPSGMLGVNFTSDGFPSRLIDDDGGKNNKTFWTVYLGGSRRPAIVSMPPSVIVDLAVGQLQKTLGVEGQPAYARVQNWANAIPTYHTKFDEALCTMARIERRTKGSVALAGNYRDGVGVPDALLSGVQHALKIDHFLRNSVK